MVEKNNTLCYNYFGFLFLLFQSFSFGGVMIKNEYIECGKIINTHGAHGGVKIDPWCNTPKDFVSLKRIFLQFENNGQYVEKKILKSSAFKQFVIADIEGVDDMDKAMLLKGTVLYAARKDFKLAEGEYFISDLEGLSVIDAENGTVYGTLLETINRGASDIYVVKTQNGEKMIPAVKEFIDRIDLEQGIFVRPIPGMLD